MRLSQTSAPASLAVSIDEARRQCALTEDTHDWLLLGLINSATQYAEKYTGAFIVQQGVELAFEQFPSSLPIYPVQSIVAIKYDDESGVERTLDSASYEVQLHGMRPEVRPIDAWPATSGATKWPVKITATVGFSVIPAPIKQAILILVQEMYAHRGETITGTSVNPSSLTAARLLSLFRRISL